MIEKTKKYYKYVIYYFEHTLINSSQNFKTSSNKPNSTQTHKILKISKMPKIS